ncbi:unnamed protein product [Rotaria magnacalcarata]|uniref:Uncharacterized protein n=1 Tax=Rotaria magnacalcarata TaxID=392030 RepID=A0A814X2R3_9BILA|nr:unnamed protein product [Rotaria magnacalcarata]CAF1673306.1 unnamed protein product [Rotaria magnacalcarata]CAF3983541.1 unnamed protein product [Rotaria magnacalcarata]CAF4089540.1 unnamed protein product [Rotaria magnacalcarata]
MLFYLLATLQFIHSISCFVTCHICPIDMNTFDYFITANHTPDTLYNCTRQATGDNCFIDLIWQLQPQQTQIALSTRDDDRSTFNEHSLSTFVSLESKDSNFIWTRSISYTCSTDNCNSLTTLKRLLNSLTLYDYFDSLKDLLRKETPFNGTWCLFKANTTWLECALSIPPESCKECSFQGMSVQGSIEICLNCLQDDIGETSITHEVDFNIADRTRLDHWILECQFNKCNFDNNGDLIRQKSISNFDFAKFLDTHNQASIFLSISKIVLVFIVVFIGVLH